MRGNAVDDEIDLTEVWTRAVSTLTDGSLTPQQRAFVALTRPVGLVGDTALLAAPNDFTKDVLETRLRPMIIRALSAELGFEVSLAVKVDDTIAPDIDEDVLDIEADAVARWRPYHGKPTIVIDPKRAFGKPIASASGVPTVALSDAVKAEGSPERVARLYEVPVTIVRDAIGFEEALHAA